jgi:DNA invertase Pin-like site-specific DNA recombinase
MRARIYTRFSTDMQDENSTRDQERVGRERAAREGWSVTGVYKDEGISGTALGNRPGALRAIRDAELGEFEVLIVMELTRLARSEDLPKLIQRLKFRRVRVIGVQDGFDSSSLTARMQAGMASIMGAEYVEMISRRVHSALEMRAKDGRATGGKAYEDGEVVREIFARFAAGESMKSIASDLNRRDIPSPGASWKERSRPRGRWQVSTLHALLRNERYIGRQIWNKSQFVKDPDSGIRKRRERPQSEWIVRACDRLIDDGTWARVQSRFTVRPGRGGALKYLLSGILECSVCGGKMIAFGSGTRRYICGTFHNAGEHACSNRSSFPRVIAEKLILEPVIEDLLSPAAIAEGIRMMRKERATPQRRPAPIDREVRELERLVQQGVLSAETAAPALHAARRRSEAAQLLEPEPEMPWPTEKHGGRQ